VKPKKKFLNLDFLQPWLQVSFVFSGCACCEQTFTFWRARFTRYGGLARHGWLGIEVEADDVHVYIWSCQAVVTRRLAALTNISFIPYRSKHASS